MKQYLLVDLTCDYKEIKSYKELRERLIELIVADAIESGYNADDKDILKNDVLMLSKLAKEDFTALNYIKEELGAFSYKVIDLLDLQRDLEDIKGYFLDKEEYVGAVCETIDKINKEVNNEKSI